MKAGPKRDMRCPACRAIVKDVPAWIIGPCCPACFARGEVSILVPADAPDD